MFDQVWSKASIFFQKKITATVWTHKKMEIKKSYTILQRVSNYLQTLEPLWKCLSVTKNNKQSFLYHIRKSSGFLVIQAYLMSKVDCWKSLLLVLCKARGITNLCLPVTLFLEKMSYSHYAYLTPKWL